MTISTLRSRYIDGHSTPDSERESSVRLYVSVAAELDGVDGAEVLTLYSNPRFHEAKPVRMGVNTATEETFLLDSTLESDPLFSFKTPR